MHKIILTKGLPASGKSTWAREQVLQGIATRFNKDNIRKELGYTNTTKAQEKEVYELERFRVEQQMNTLNQMNPPINHTIIVDNTHLGPNNKHVQFYKELAEKYFFEFEIKFFDTPYEECIRRDVLRSVQCNPSVGWEVIKHMKELLDSESAPPKHPTFDKIDGSKPPCIIVDIDGTLAFSEHRNPYDYDKVQDDRFNNYLGMLMDGLVFGLHEEWFEKKPKVIIVSGRDDSCLDISKQWLDKNLFGYDEIYFRKTGDKRKDSIVKKEIYDEHIKGKYNVLAVFDDRDQVVKQWRDLGLPCYQVWYGDF